MPSGRSGSTRGRWTGPLSVVATPRAIGLGETKFCCFFFLYCPANSATEQERHLRCLPTGTLMRMCAMRGCSLAHRAWIRVTVSNWPLGPLGGSAHNDQPCRV